MVDSLICSLVKEVVFVNGLPTVISKILPRCRIHKFVIVVIPGNPGLVEFYDVFVTSLFNSLKGQWPIYAISHAGKDCKFMSIVGESIEHRVSWPWVHLMVTTLRVI